MTPIELRPIQVRAGQGALSVRGERLVAALLLTCAVAFNLVWIYPEVSIDAPRINEDVLHALATQRAAGALSGDGNVTDPWLPTIGLGYPLFHASEHLPYYPVAALYLLLNRAVPIDVLLDWTRYVALSLFPLSIFWAMRRFGFDTLTASFAGLAAPLLSTNGLYGLEAGSYVWRGHGLSTQLWGMLFLPLALAQGYTALRTGRGYFGAALLTVVTLLCHVMFGFIVLASFVVFALLSLADQRGLSATVRATWRSGRRLLLLLLLTIVASAYVLVPYVFDNQYINRGIAEIPSDDDSHGFQWVMSSLSRGDLFDYGRLPVLTIVVAVGLAASSARWREGVYRVPVALFLVCLALYSGRPTWGPLLDYLPLSRELQFHRLIAGVHLGGIFLIGAGLAFPWRWARRQQSPWPLVAAAVFTGLALFPAFQERMTYLNQNAAWMEQSRDAYRVEEPRFTALEQMLRALPPGRVYAGLPTSWGGDYRIGSTPAYAVLQSDGFDMVGYFYHTQSLNSDVEMLFDERRPEQYNLFNIRYVVAPAGQSLPEFVRPLADFGRHRLYQVSTSGYFDVVRSDLELIGSKQEVFPAAATWLTSELVRAGQYPVVNLERADPDYRVSFPLPTADLALAELPATSLAVDGRVLQEAVLDDGYWARVQVGEPSVLLVKSTYHPGWRATVDGIEAPTRMLMPSYVGVPLLPGEHRVELSYQPTPMRDRLGLFGALALLLAFVAEWQRPALASLAARLAPNRALTWLGSRGTTRWRGGRPRPGVATSPATIAAPETSRKVGQLPQSSQTLDRAPSHIKTGLYLLFFAVYLLSAAGHFFSTDHVAVYLTTESLVEDHSLAIKPIPRAVPGPEGAFYSRYGLFQSVASIPFYVFGSWVDRVGPDSLRHYFGGIEQGDFGGSIPIYFVSLLNVFVTPLIGILVFLFSRRLGFPTPVALATTLLYGFGTLAWTYARDYFQHPLESLFLLLTIYLLFASRERLTPGTALLSGGAFALGILTRLNLALVLPALVVYVFFLSMSRDAAHRSGTPTGRHAAVKLRDRIVTPFRGVPLHQWPRLPVVQNVVAFVALPLFAFILFLTLNYLRFGDYRDPGFNNVTNGSRDISAGLFGNLLSPGRSIFLYSPPAIFVLFTFRAFARRFRAEAVLFATICLIYLVTYSIPVDWDGGWSWGPRYLLATVPLLVLPVGYFLTSKVRFVVAGAVGLLGAGVQILGITINYAYVYWDWINMKLNPETAYLFSPPLSAIPTHLRDLIAGRHLDFWLLWVWREYGAGALMATMSGPLIAIVVAIVMLRHATGGRVSETAGDGRDARDDGRWQLELPGAD